MFFTRIYTSFLAVIIIMRKKITGYINKTIGMHTITQRHLEFYPQASSCIVVSKKTI